MSRSSIWLLPVLALFVRTFAVPKDLDGEELLQTEEQTVKPAAIRKHHHDTFATVSSEGAIDITHPSPVDLLDEEDSIADASSSLIRTHSKPESSMREEEHRGSEHSHQPRNTVPHWDNRQQHNHNDRRQSNNRDFANDGEDERDENDGSRFDRREYNSVPTRPRNIKMAQQEAAKFEAVVAGAEAEAGLPDTIHNTPKPDLKAQAADERMNEEEMAFMWIGISFVVISMACTLSWHVYFSKVASPWKKQAASPLIEEADEDEDEGEEQVVQDAPSAWGPPMEAPPMEEEWVAPAQEESLDGHAF